MSELTPASTRCGARERFFGARMVRTNGRAVMTTPIAAAVAAAIIASAIGCSSSRSDDPPAEPTSSAASGSASSALASGLTQTIRVTPASPRSGENVTVRSVLRNGGTAPVDVESRICSLGLEGTLKLELPPDMAVCAGFSQRAPLAPGDSVVQASLQRVASPPGTYSLVVRHSLSPEGAAELRVTVQ